MIFLSRASTFDGSSFFPSPQLGEFILLENAFCFKTVAQEPVFDGFQNWHDKLDYLLPESTAAQAPS